MRSALAACRPPSIGEVPAPETPSRNCTIIRPNSAMLSLVVVGDQRPISAVIMMMRASGASRVPSSPWAPKLLSLKCLSLTVVKAP
jgi:hypothetical protein